MPVARILKPHGLEGEVVVELCTDAPERLTEDGSVTLSAPGQVGEFKVESVRPTTGERALMKFRGVDDRDEAERLRGRLVQVDRQSIPPPPEGAYYDFQIVGLRVITTAGKQLGRVTEIIRTGANDIYATDDVLIPAVDNVIVAIDLERGEMTVEEVEGLLG